MADILSPTQPAQDTRIDASSKNKPLFSPKEYKRKLSKRGKDMHNGNTGPTANGTGVVGTGVDEAGSSGANGTVADNQARGNGEASSNPRTGAASNGRIVDGSTSTGQVDGDEKDKNSQKSTLGGTATSSKHKKEKQTSDATHSSSTEKPSSRASVKKTSKSKKKKKSIWSKLASAFFHCRWSADNPHPVDIDEHASGVSDPSSSSLEPKEKVVQTEPLKEEVTQDAVVQPVPNDNDKGIVQGTPDDSVPPPVAPVLEQSPDDSPNVPAPQPATPDRKGDLEAITSGGVQAPGSSGREHETESEDTSFIDDEMQEAEDEEDRLIREGGAGIPVGPDGVPRPLLPPIAPQHAGRKCLVLDLDETLVHSSFKSIQHADYVVPVEIEYHWHNVYVIKRPGVDNFLKKMGEIYEVVVFTASLSKYADPVLDKLDIHQVVSHRLFRESCYNHKGNYVKDLSQLGRPIADTIILDNSPASYIFHPNNAVPVSSWFNDPHDTELTDLVPFLADLGQVEDVRGVLDGGL